MNETTKELPGENFDLDTELEWSHATALGEAVWHRMCRSRGKDPKDLALSRMHDQIVGFVRDSAFVLERDGFDGLATWLEAEQVNETEGGEK